MRNEPDIFPHPSLRVTSLSTVPIGRIPFHRPSAPPPFQPYQRVTSLSTVPAGQKKIAGGTTTGTPNPHPFSRAGGAQEAPHLNRLPSIQFVCPQFNLSVPISRIAPIFPGISAISNKKHGDSPRAIQRSLLRRSMRRKSLS